MVEPMEETRSELTFVTELITSSLGMVLSAVGSSKRDRPGRPPGDTGVAGEIDLDETEIQKGTLQIAKGLAFLHQQAKMVHLNLSPDAILINAKVCRVLIFREENLITGRLEALGPQSHHTAEQARRHAYEIRLPRDRLEITATGAVEAGLPR